MREEMGWKKGAGESETYRYPYRDIYTHSGLFAHFLCPTLLGLSDLFHCPIIPQSVMDNIVIMKENVFALQGNLILVRNLIGWSSHYLQFTIKTG